MAFGRPTAQWKLKAIFICLMILGTLIIFEVLLRISGKYNTFYEDFSGEYISHYDSEGMDWYKTHPPNIRDTMVTREYAYPKFTNSIGLRDIDHPLQKDSAEFRFIGLGDSFTECWGAPFDSSWTQLLQGEIRALYPNRKVTGIQAGVSGSDPFFGYMLLRDKLMDYQPDWLIYAINASDIDDVIIRGGMSRFQEDGSLRFNPAPRIEKIFRYSHLVRFVVDDIMHYNYMLLSIKESMERSVKAKEQIRSIFNEMNELSDANNMKFLVVFHPLINELEGDAYIEDLGTLRDELREDGVEVLDLMPYFKDEYEMQRDIYNYYWPYDAHYNSHGYDAFAQGVFEKYLEMFESTQHH